MTLKDQSQGHLDFEAFISRIGAGLGPMLLLNIYRKGCMGSLLVQLHLTLVTLICQCHSDFEGLYLLKGPS